MHVQEQSDCAVVPMNQPNKEGQPSAEVGDLCRGRSAMVVPTATTIFLANANRFL